MMLLFGHSFIKSEKFYHVQSIDAILKTPSNSTIYLEFSQKNLDIISYMNDNSISFALYVKSILELIYASSLNATYIFVDKAFAKDAQNIAEEYLFDAKIIAHITNEDEIEELAVNGVDGVAFAKAIIKINS